MYTATQLGLSAYAAAAPVQLKTNSPLRDYPPAHGYDLLGSQTCIIQRQHRWPDRPPGDPC